MTTRTFKAMGSAWWIRCDRPGLLDRVEPLVDDIEARLSRFLETSALSQLNRDRRAEDPVLAEVTRIALTMAEQTDGFFDPTLGARLAELGYDRSFEQIERPSIQPAEDTTEPLRVHVDGDRVTLDGPGELDLGGIAKGWTVDRVVEQLRSDGAASALVDAGGDLRGLGGPWSIALEEGPGVDLTDAAVATSSTRRRRWQTDQGRRLHHLLAPETGTPACGPLETVTVLADDAATADALATAVLVAPDQLLGRLSRWNARAAVRAADGDWWTTPDWKEAS